MSAALEPVDMAEARAAVSAVGARVSALIRSVSNPDVPALGSWNLTDVAVHLSHAVDAIAYMAAGTGMTAESLWDLIRLNEMLVRGESERDLSVLAGRIDASVARLLATLGAEPDNPLRPWIVTGVQLPLSGIACHALNELVVHGWDLARAEGAPWPVYRHHASLVLRGFMLPVLGANGRAMVDQEAAAGATVTYALHLRGGGRAYLRFDDGDVSVSSDAPGPVDCHLSVDPTAFLMVAWGRTPQWKPILTGKLLAYGRKPWLGLRLRSMLRNP